jgi:hypothetical protein
LKTGVPTVCVIVTVCVETAGPLQPVAVAVIIDVPNHAAVYTTAPEVALIVFPAAKLASSKVYVIPVLVVAVAGYETVAAPWQRVDVAPRPKTGVPTVATTVTVCVAVLGPLQPAALAVMVVVPLHPAA